MLERRRPACGPGASCAHSSGASAQARCLRTACKDAGAPVQALRCKRAKKEIASRRESDLNGPAIFLILLVKRLLVLHCYANRLAQIAKRNDQFLRLVTLRLDLELQIAH